MNEVYERSLPATVDMELNPYKISDEFSHNLEAMTDAELGNLIVHMMGSEAAIALIKNKPALFTEVGQSGCVRLKAL